MTWQDVKSRIEAQIDENWLKEPEAMWKTRHGINVTGAGSFNQYLSTMMFVDVYTIAYGQHMAKVWAVDLALAALRMAKVPVNLLCPILKTLLRKFWR